MIENTCPILSVSDLRVTLDYFTQKLGFHEDWCDEGIAAGVSRDRGGLMLIVDQGPTGSYVWIGIQDANALYAEFLAAGAEIRHEPQNYPWSLEFKVVDPDGNVLRFGSNPDPKRAYDTWTP